MRDSDDLDLLRLKNTLLGGSTVVDVVDVIDALSVSGFILTLECAAIAGREELAEGPWDEGIACMIAGGLRQNKR